MKLATHIANATLSPNKTSCALCVWIVYLTLAFVGGTLTGAWLTVNGF